MKNETQVLNFLSAVTFKSEPDFEMIHAFCKQRSKQRKYSLDLDPTFTETGITASEFAEWYNNGFGSGDVAEMGGELVILGPCGINEVEIAAKNGSDGFQKVKIRISTTQLSKVSENRFKEAYRRLSEQGLQYDRNNERIIVKYLPSVNHRIEFYNDSVRGLGIVREVRPEDNYVELYCYYLYDTDQVGYSMHEKDVCTFHEFTFLPMSRYCYLKLNRELAKHGKTWYDKIHRIEPLSVRVEVGERYWYIDDKMSVVTDRERGTRTCALRYIAGNYFNSLDEALAYSGRFADMLRDRLALPEDKQKTEGR